MQKPLNTSERSSAFWKFFFFFLITVTMVTTAVYFNFRMPYKENEILKEKAETMRIQSMAQEKFTSNMVQAKALLDSMGKPGVNVKYIGDQVTSKISDLGKIQFADSSLQGSMNRVILAVLLDFNKIKSENVGSADAQSQIADLQSKNDLLTRDKEQLNRDLDFCRTGTGR